jgi:hypothetical protein
MDNVVELLPRAEREEVEEMRKSLLKVDNDRDAMQRIEALTGRVADILAEVDGISVQDRLSLQWHLSLIRELAVDRKGGIKPLCSLPRFSQRSEDRAREDLEPDGGA